MSARWRVLALVTGAQAGASLVQQALGSLSPFLVTTFGLNKTQLGMIFSAMLLGSASFTAAAGIFTDRLGERRMLLLAGVTMSGALLAATLIPTYAWLVATMTLFGAGYAISTPAGGRAILAWFDRDRGFAMGIRQTGVPIGGTLGALSLPFIAQRFGYRGAFAFAAAVALLPTLVAFVCYREAPVTGTRTRGGTRALLRDPRLIAITLTCMILICAQAALNGFLTVTAVADVGLSPATAALAFAVAQASAAAARLWWGFASDRFFGGDRLVPLTIICVLGALACGWLAVIGTGAVVPLFCAAALLGCSAAGWNGLMAAGLAEVGGVERAASALGIALTAMFGASAVAPTLFGALADRTSLHLAWAVVCGVTLVGIVPVLRLRGALAPAVPRR